MTLRSIYLILVVIASSLTVLATFLPWVSLDVELPLVGSIGEVTRHGYQGDGLISLILGLLAVSFAAYVWFERSPSAFRLVTVFNAALGAVIFAIAIVNLVDSQRAAGDAQRQLGVDLEALVGIDLQGLVETREGIYVTIAAGAVLTLASLATLAAHRMGADAAPDALG